MALPQTRPRPQRALTASAVKLEPKESTSTRRRAEAWQKRALFYVDEVPECNYASRFYARMLKRIHIFPAIREADDKLTPITTGEPVDLLDRIQDPGGGRSQLQGSYGRLMFVTGEGYLFGRDLQTEDEKWSFVWNEEIELGDGGEITWKNDNSSKGKVYSSGEAEAYRMWHPSPMRSGLAESPMRSVLEVAEELLILTKGVRATAVSRMINGMLKIPTEMSFGAAEPGVDEDPEANIFLADLIEHITGVVENAGTAEAAAPFIAEGAAEFLDKIDWMAMHDPQTDYMERELRKEAVQRLAFGFDMPPEVLLGLADSNHWTGKQITSDMWRSHGAPVAEQFCDDLSEAYLRPALRAEGFTDWQKVVVTYDDADVVISPDRSEDADKALDRGALGYAGYRKLKGIPEDMAPTDAEHEEWLAVKLRAPQALGEDFQPPGQRGPAAGPPDTTNAEDGPPEPGPSGVSRQEARTASARVLGAAELSLIRCRELAGARLRNHSESHPDLFGVVNGEPNSVVASRIDRKKLIELGIEIDALQLVRGGTDAFHRMITEWGYPKPQADALSQMLLVYAARTLFDETQPPLASGFESQVERMMEVTDALEGDKA